MPRPVVQSYSLSPPASSPKTNGGDAQLPWITVPWAEPSRRERRRTRAPGDRPYHRTCGPRAFRPSLPADASPSPNKTNDEKREGRRRKGVNRRGSGGGIGWRGRRRRVSRRTLRCPTGRIAGAKGRPRRWSTHGGSGSSRSTGEISAGSTGRRWPSSSTLAAPTSRGPPAATSSARTGSTLSRRSTRWRGPGSWAATGRLRACGPFTIVLISW